MLYLKGSKWKNMMRFLKAKDPPSTILFASHSHILWSVFLTSRSAVPAVICSIIVPSVLCSFTAAICYFPTLLSMLCNKSHLEKKCINKTLGAQKKQPKEVSLCIPTNHKATPSWRPSSKEWKKSRLERCKSLVIRPPSGIFLFRPYFYKLHHKALSHHCVFIFVAISFLLVTVAIIFFCWRKY